jgi:5,10-methenyltetrahydrofolate synthetase
MGGVHDGDDASEGGSAPCLMHALGADGTSVVDPRQAQDVARWRKAERERLLAARAALSPESRAAQTAAIAADLERLIPGSGAQIVSVYWPIRAEPDLRAWMHSRSERGTRIALPVALAHGQPLEFREWHPGARLAHGLWRIPYPADGPEVTPTVVLAPMVGFDLEGYRLGYGGGFFDRTLAVLRPRPLVIGLGYGCGALRTIYPQPHDIPMDWVVTGTSPARYRTAALA